MGDMDGSMKTDEGDTLWLADVLRKYEEDVFPQFCIEGVHIEPETFEKMQLELESDDPKCIDFPSAVTERDKNVVVMNESCDEGNLSLSEPIVQSGGVDLGHPKKGRVLPHTGAGELEKELNNRDGYLTLKNSMGNVKLGKGAVTSNPSSKVSLMPLHLTEKWKNRATGKRGGGQQLLRQQKARGALKSGRSGGKNALLVQVFECQHCLTPFPTIDLLSTHICNPQNAIHFDIILDASSCSNDLSCLTNPSVMEMSVHGEKVIQEEVVPLVTTRQSFDMESIEGEAIDIEGCDDHCQTSPPRHSKDVQIVTESIPRVTREGFLQKMDKMNVHPNVKTHSFPSQHSANNSHVQKMMLPSETGVGEAQHECQHCGALFTDHASLYIHTKGHWRKTRSICRICWLRFLSAEDLGLHTLLHSSGFQCPKCHKPFQTEEELTEHKKRHNEQSLHVVDGHVFIMEVSSMEGKGQYCPVGEESSHQEGCTKFSCTDCGQRFVTLGELGVHSRRMHRQTFYCYKCALCFFSHAAYDAHLISHGDMSTPIQISTQKYFSVLPPILV